MKTHGEDIGSFQFSDLRKLGHYLTEFSILETSFVKQNALCHRIRWIVELQNIPSINAFDYSNGKHCNLWLNYKHFSSSSLFPAYGLQAMTKVMSWKVVSISNLNVEIMPRNKVTLMATTWTKILESRFQLISKLHFGLLGETDIFTKRKVYHFQWTIIHVVS